VAEGVRGDCERLVELLRGGATPGDVAGVRARFDPAEGRFAGFVER